MIVVCVCYMVPGMNRNMGNKVIWGSLTDTLQLHRPKKNVPIFLPHSYIPHSYFICWFWYKRLKGGKKVHSYLLGFSTLYSKLFWCILSITTQRMHEVTFRDRQRFPSRFNNKARVVTVTSASFACVPPGCCRKQRDAHHRCSSVADEGWFFRELLCQTRTLSLDVERTQEDGCGHCCHHCCNKEPGPWGESHAVG